MAAGKGTYGSKVGRPSKKKKMYGGTSAKSMAKNLAPMKKGGAKKKLKKAQPGNIVGAAPAIGTGGMYDQALKALGLPFGKKPAGAGSGIFTKAISSLGKAALTAKEAQQLKDFGLANPDTVSNIPPPPDIPRKKGGSVTNAKALRNYSRGGARKNR